MKKTFIFGLIAAALGFTACSSEDDLNVNNENNKKGMVLRATVEQPAESRATFTDNEGVWQFAFAEDDKISVTNMGMPADFYTFTNDGTEFKSEDAKAAASPIAWYAYFPSNTISLTGQSGAKTDVANLYALAGKTGTATTGEEGLNITMSPKVAILVINNQKGSIDINVKNSSSTWVKGLEGNDNSFNVTTESTKQTILSVTTTGTYYVAVPAGVQLAVKDGDDVVKSTGTSGLTAGKYYNLTIFPFGQGEAAATGIGNVKWIRLWENGLKFAEYNVGAKKNMAEDYGGYYCWGNTAEQSSNWTGQAGTDDIATKLWGSNWRMPTKDEMGLLSDITKCTATWVNNGSNSGLLVQGLARTSYASNSIFLPAAGHCYCGDVHGPGDDGRYWSSTPSDSYGAYYLFFRPRGQSVNNDLRIGYSVRAVLAE